MTPDIWKKLFALGALFCLAWTAGCQASKTSEQLEVEAQGLYDEADRLWRTNEEKKALAVYDEIAKAYKITKVAEKLKGELALKNIYFGSAANSWTNLRMYELENLLVEVYKEKGEYPEAFPTGQDAWDTLITYKLFESNQVDFDFMIVSAGADKKFNTADDLRLVHAKNAALARPVGNAAEEIEHSPFGDAASLENLDRAISQSGGKNHGDENQELSLQDLDKSMGSKKKDPGHSKKTEGAVELKDLIEGNL